MTVLVQTNYDDWLNVDHVVKFTIRTKLDGGAVAKQDLYAETVDAVDVHLLSCYDGEDPKHAGAPEDAKLALAYLVRSIDQRIAERGGLVRIKQYHPGMKRIAEAKKEADEEARGHGAIYDDPDDHAAES